MANLRGVSPNGHRIDDPHPKVLATARRIEADGMHGGAALEISADGIASPLLNGLRREGVFSEVHAEDPEGAIERLYMNVYTLIALTDRSMFLTIPSTESLGFTAAVTDGVAFGGYLVADLFIHHADETGRVTEIPGLKDWSWSLEEMGWTMFSGGLLPPVSRVVDQNSVGDFTWVDVGHTQIVSQKPDETTWNAKTEERRNKKATPSKKASPSN